MATETASASSTTSPLTGCVKWFNNGLNYGFITVLSEGVNRNSDIFVHQSNIRTAKECFRTLYTGECVQFELANSDNEKHPVHAVNVRGFNGVQLRCEVPRGNGFGRIGGSSNGRGRGGGRGRGNGRGGFFRNVNSSNNHQQSEDTTQATATPTTPATPAIIETTPQAAIDSVISGTTELLVSTPLDNASVAASAAVSVAKGRGRGRGRKISV